MKNNKEYIGAHTTTNIDDGYMGSGKYILMSIKKHGIENFRKDILFDLNSVDEMFEKEKELVNEVYVKRMDTYNMKPGGSGNHKNWSTFKNKFNDYISCSKFDERVLSGEYVGVSKGIVTTTNGTVSQEEFSKGGYKGICKNKVPVIDNNGNNIQMTCEEYNKGSYTATMNKNGSVNVFDIDGNRLRITSEEYQNNKETFISVDKGLVTTKNKNGKTLKVSKNEFDNNADLVGITKGQNNNPSEYHIFDSEGLLVYKVINTNFIKFCKELKLPYGALNISQQNKGKPIYQNIGSNKKRLEKSNMIQYVGWYAINIKGKLNGKK